MDYSVSISELNIGGKRRIAIDEEFIYYSGVNDKSNLYRIDKELKNKHKLYDGEVIGNIIISNDIIYFTEIIQEENQSKFRISSIDKEGDSYNIILNDVISFTLLDGKLYYYKDSGENSGEPNQYPLAFFCSYDPVSKKEQIVDEKIILVQSPIVYNSKIYYCGSDYRFIEYDPLTFDEREMNMEINYFYRFYRGNIFSYKGNIIEKTNISDNTRNIVLSDIDEIYNIWDMNVVAEYIFFLAEEKAEVYVDINRLHLFRMKHDGSELTKIYTTDYITPLFTTKQLIYCIGDKLMLYDYDMTEHIVNREPIQIIDFNGKEIETNL